VVTILNSPPQSYQDWLNCFEIIIENNLGAENLKIIKAGKLTGGPEVLLLFQRQLAVMLNVLLGQKIIKFTKQLNQLLECNESESIIILFKRFNKDLRDCLFFVDLQFIPEAEKTQLAQSVSGQLREFQQKVIKYLKLSAKKNNDYDLFYTLRQIKLVECQV
jgi:hypothetical protein